MFDHFGRTLGHLWISLEGPPMDELNVEAVEFFTKRLMYFHETSKRPLYFLFLLKSPLSDNQAIQRFPLSLPFFNV